MTSKEKKQRLRLELEFVPIEIEEKIIKHIHDEFEKLLNQLIKSNHINMQYGASLIMIDVTPIEWVL